MKRRNMLAIDLGASNGRALLGSFDGKILNLQSIHRFPNEPVYAGGHWHWDVLRLYKEIQDGIRGACAFAGGPLDSLGVDAWGVDFGLLDSRDELVGNPFHYRDSRIEGMVEAAFKMMSPALLYKETGNSFEKYNTIFQLMATLEANPDALAFGKTLLLMADLFVFLLTGEKATEFTAASTTQLLSAGRPAWNARVREAMGIPSHLFTRIESPACIRGRLLRSLASETGVTQFPVATVAHHDTASAVAALPMTGNSYAFLNSGTWSLMGIETAKPVLNDVGRDLGYTNEGCVGGSYRLLKNIMGLWLLQECKRCWDVKGNNLDFAGLCALASGEAPLRSFIDPSDDAFFAPGDMPGRIQTYCRRTHQAVPETTGQIVRCILESLALKYRWAFSNLEKVSGLRLAGLQIVGGGSRNSLLNQFTANATQRPVKAGPEDATALGNLVVQAIALGEIDDLASARNVIAASFPVSEYHPVDQEQWEEGFLRFEALMEQKEE